MTEAARKSRLSRSAEFDRVYRHGRSAQHRLLVVYRFERPDDVPSGADGACRIGITVSKKVGNAVVRNRTKRQLRAAFDAIEGMDGTADFVAIAKPGLPELVERDGFDALGEMLAELLVKLQPSAS